MKIEYESNAKRITTNDTIVFFIKSPFTIIMYETTNLYNRICCLQSFSLCTNVTKTYGLGTTGQLLPEREGGDG